MKIKSIWSTITGGVSSAFPILFACCKGGACVGVCVTPVASLFGISAATIAASPVINMLEPVFIALSAVSFTVSYYSLYVIPKIKCSTGNSCACEPTVAEKRKTNISRLIFWLGIVLSIGCISYFEYTRYSASLNASCSANACSDDRSENCSTPMQSGSCDNGEAEGCSEEGGACCGENTETNEPITQDK